MEKNYKFANVTDRQLKQMGVQALADRPNAAQQYGQSGLSATQLKQWFDKLAELLSGKVNELQNAINGEDAAKYIGLALKEYETLDALIEGMQDGSFAESVLMLMPNENALALSSLQDIIYGIAQSFSTVEEDIENLDDSKVSKVETTGNYRRAYGVDKYGNQTILTVSEAPVNNAVAAYDGNGILKSKMSPVNYPGWKDITAPDEVVTMTFIEEMQRHIGAGLKLSIDHQTYVFIIEIVNIFGEVIYRADPIDLPLENLVVRGEYADGYIVLTLQNGDQIKFEVANLVDGLVPSAKYNVDIQNLNNKIEAYLNAYVEGVYQLLGDDYSDYS